MNMASLFLIMMKFNKLRSEGYQKRFVMLIYILASFLGLAILAMHIINLFSSSTWDEFRLNREI